MRIFDFKLRPLKEVIGWGAPPNQTLSWFGLTDGYYQVKFGNQVLYRPTIESIKRHKPNFAIDQLNSEFDLNVDYQVARLYEDLLYILPNVMQELPDEIFQLVSTFDLHKNLQHVYFEGDDPWCDSYEIAAGWYENRCLTSIHLKQGPTAVFIRYHDEVIIRWDNRIEVEKSELMWSPTFGEFRIPFEQFMDEISDFHSQLMMEMEHRIQIIQHDNPIPHIKIDLNALLIEHENRKYSLETAIEHKPTVDDWDKVIASNQLLYPFLFKS
jgi:hypothetical protein